jgi:hypothetical protein
MKHAKDAQDSQHAEILDRLAALESWRLENARFPPLGAVAPAAAVGTSASSSVPDLNHFISNTSLRSAGTFVDGGLHVLQRSAIFDDAAARQLKQLLREPTAANLAKADETVYIMLLQSQVLAASVDAARSCNDKTLPAGSIVFQAFDHLEGHVLNPTMKVAAGQKRISELLNLQQKGALYGLVRGAEQGASSSSAIAATGFGHMAPMAPFAEQGWNMGMPMGMPMCNMPGGYPAYGTQCPPQQGGHGGSNKGINKLGGGKPQGKPT